MSEIKTFKFSILLEVRVSDVNYGGHVGNDSFIQYFQEARMKYLQQFNFSEGDIGNGIGMILTEIQCEYKAESFYSDTLHIHVRVPSMKRASFTMEYEIHRRKDDKLIAKGSSRQVAFDYNTRKPVAIPAGFKVKVQEFEEDIQYH